MQLVHSDDDDCSENVTKVASFQTLSRVFAPAEFIKCTRLPLELNS